MEFTLLWSRSGFTMWLDTQLLRIYAQIQGEIFSNAEFVLNQTKFQICEVNKQRRCRPHFSPLHGRIQNKRVPTV